jgi:hypothetical protein
MQDGACSSTSEGGKAAAHPYQQEHLQLGAVLDAVAGQQARAQSNREAPDKVDRKRCQWEVRCQLWSYSGQQQRRAISQPGPKRAAQTNQCQMFHGAPYALVRRNLTLGHA